MKINSTVLLTLMLLILMLGAGSVSAFLGFEMGSSALKGVTTPDGRPRTKFPGSKANNSPQLGVTLLKEDEILKIVKARIEGKTKAAKSEKLEEDDQETKTSKPKPKEKPPAVVVEKLEPGFPIIAESEGVTFAVQSVRYSGGDLLMRVNMQNQSSDTVRFLYTFLDVSDDKGRTLSASTDGLPTELPAKSPAVSGTVIIPTALLDDVNKISLSLTDYPAQKLKLKVLDVPVER
ncbi:hypothetical protein [Umezakia ovalisporum]|uniref:Uncharacterized protein n=2 Tax=Umezakia ovalisporum TaxID=75695 RepID=A0AA43GYM2_9CYAN|nr:hypothetical protein [Umezakia ovalisporum]MBI1240295.1 hypothetical protein [Nostoc sp. RI_552]MDH6057248.1 hypothetical protein [Umezakia ovalisporum FSS-43]MDH6063632.1 hypothetical protein [Umezakia ovalisporum FSS-62]MDH6068796.1 hypothetical protein [Umezakia ovalisporum APH033B]MDH6070285.1 hypothetical protein [Umezakia ovalisporum CobakiLakeA]